MVWRGEPWAGFWTQTVWGNFADWQVTNSRQTEWWNWTSACQKISNYVSEFWKATHLGIARCMMFNICGVKLKGKRGVHLILHLKQNYVGCLVSFLFTLCWYLFSFLFFLLLFSFFLFYFVLNGDIFNVIWLVVLFLMFLNFHFVHVDSLCCFCVVYNQLWHSFVIFKSFGIVVFKFNFYNFYASGY